MKLVSKIAAGIGAAVAGGATFFYVRELATEKPAFELIEEDGACSIRRYPALIVAETLRTGRRESALRSGFGVLADYIFAESREGEAIAMTAPVIAEPRGDNWRVRFVMPGKWTRGTLPEPGPGVSIADVPARTVAAIRFAGRAGDADLARHVSALRDWMKQRDLRSSGEAEHAFYNSPFIPGPLRRNEILIELASNQTG
jgi:hypothetical protein